MLPKGVPVVHGNRRDTFVSLLGIAALLDVGRSRTSRAWASNVCRDTFASLLGVATSCCHSERSIKREAAAATTSCHRLRVTPSNRLIVTPSHRLIVTPCHRLIVTPCHRLNVTPCHRLSVTPCHRFSVTSCHRLSVTPCHRRPRHRHCRRRRRRRLHEVTMSALPLGSIRCIAAAISARRWRF